jgi:nicotinamide-nucleotide amidase
MRCDVLAIGTELLLGQITDTNSQWIGEQLAAVGVDSLLQVKVGDNLGRMEAVLRSVLADADAVIVCGGLGPTHDDLTREAIAAVMGTTLEPTRRWPTSSARCSPSRGQAHGGEQPAPGDGAGGARVIPQTRGTAPGLICPVTLDGAAEGRLRGARCAPRDEGHGAARVLPDLLARSGEDAAVIVSRTLRTWGESESGLNERLDPLIARLDEVGNPTLAFNASGWEGIKVRLTAKAASDTDGAAVLATWEARDSCAGRRPRVRRRRRDHGVRGAAAAARARVVAGPRRVGHRRPGRRAHHQRARRQRGVPRQRRQLRQRGEVRRARCAPRPGGQRSRSRRDGCKGAQRVLGSHVALALTGVAGPTEQDGMPVGTLCVGIAIGPEVHTRTLRMPGQRDQMRQMSVISRARPPPPHDCSR